jgi:hypothetical protein
MDLTFKTSKQLCRDPMNNGPYMRHDKILRGKMHDCILFQAYQTRTVLSALAEAIKRPSADQATP